jgi:hypothetical protein
MSRFRLPLTRLLTLLLLAQWAAAFVPCFAAAAAVEAGAHSVEICGGDGGLHTILLDADGRPVPEPAAHHPTCPDCGGPAALEPPPPERAAVPVLWSVMVPAPAPADARPAAQARAPPQQPRAPPSA